MKKTTLKTTKDKIKQGIDILADIVKTTLGAKGKNVVINNGFEQPKIINDGVTIAKEVEIEDEILNTGATLAKQAAEKTNEEAGDGTTTTIVLLQAFLEQLKLIKSSDVRETRKKIKKRIDQIIKYINIQKKKISSGDIYKIALNSSLDKKIAKTIEAVIKKIGKDGIISTEDGTKAGVTFEVVSGIKIYDGYVSPYMITEQEKLKATIKKAPVLISTKPITSVNDILPIMDELAKQGKNELVIFIDEITDEVIAPLILNKVKGIFSTYIVKTKDVEEIEIITGAKKITAENGKTFSTDNLGISDKIEITKHNTIVTAGAGEEIEENIKNEIKKLEKIVKNKDNKIDEEEKFKASERIAKLKGGVALIKIAGENQQETKEKKLKLEDAISAVKAAMDDGVIQGGGFAYIEAVNFVLQGQAELDEVDKLIHNVLITPTIQILKNADEDYKKIMKEYQKSKGYNVITREWEDLIESGIIDPAKVVKSALINAFAMGTSISTVEAGIFYGKENQKKEVQKN